MAETTISEAKQAIRERVWTELEAAGAAEPGVRGSIPAFAGAEAAAMRLAGRAEWAAARSSRPSLTALNCPCGSRR